MFESEGSPSFLSSTTMMIDAEITKTVTATPIAGPQRIKTDAIPNPPTATFGTAPEAELCWTAVASMIVGIVGLSIGLGVCLGPIAMCMGIQAKHKIRQSQGRLTGSGYAVAGIILGVVGVFMGVVLLILAGFFIIGITVAGVDSDYEVGMTLEDDFLQN